MPRYTVTGRVWNAETREHDKLASIDFERLIDATGYMALNKDWIKGMVLDRDAEARRIDKENEEWLKRYNEQ